LVHPQAPPYKSRPDAPRSPLRCALSFEVGREERRSKGREGGERITSPDDIFQSDSITGQVQDSKLLLTLTAFLLARTNPGTPPASI
jgi:hypothetical protein